MSSRLEECVSASSMSVCWYVASFRKRGSSELPLNPPLTRIVVQYTARRVVERDWRIVVVPGEDASSGATVLSLFLCKQQGHSVLLKQ